MCNWCAYSDKERELIMLELPDRRNKYSEGEQILTNENISYS